MRTAPLVLVHSPLVGPVTWGPVARTIRERGHQVTCPDLTEATLSGPPYWPRQVAAVAADVDAVPAIVVGHSGAGPLLPAVGRALGRIDGYVFVDAGLPNPGRSWVETAPRQLVERLRGMAQDGWLPPWPEWWAADQLAQLLPEPDLRARFVGSCPRLPMALFEEPQAAAPDWPEAPCAYLLLSQAYRAAADRAGALGWPVLELPSTHLGLLTEPELVADALLDLARRLHG